MKSPRHPWLALLLLAACRSPAVILNVADAAAPDEAADAHADPPAPDGHFGFAVYDAQKTADRPAPDAAPPPELDCTAAAAQKSNAGCSFFPLRIPRVGYDGCFAMFVVNPGSQPAKLRLSRAGQSFSLAQVARLPRGGGQSIRYAAFDETAGLPANDVAILFLTGAPASPDSVACPKGIQPAVMKTDDLPDAFHLVSDRPVIGYQIVPYGGGDTGGTSSTLLFPEEAWGTSYRAATTTSRFAFVTVIAADDGTEVAFQPPGGAAQQVTLHAGGTTTFWGPMMGQGLSGSSVVASKPVGVIGGTPDDMLPGYSSDGNLCCADSAQQMIPPLESWGSEYAGVRHTTRVKVEEKGMWQLVGAVPGTTLTYQPAPPPGAPTSLGPGDVVEFFTTDPFVVRSQDDQHPFYLSAFMTSASFADPVYVPFSGNTSGDPEFVYVAPTAQYATSYVFFTDPTYPRTDLVLVRKRGGDGQFAEVRLECAHDPVTGWQPLGDLQFARVELVVGGKPTVPGCDNGRQVISSAAPFSVTVWGWNDIQVSYGYAAGAVVRKINQLPPPIIR